MNILIKLLYRCTRRIQECNHSVYDGGTYVIILGMLSQR